MSHENPFEFVPSNSNQPPKSSRRLWLSAASIFVGAMLLAFAVSLATGSKKESGGGSYTPSITVTPLELVDAYDANVATADTKYTSRIIAVKGRILNIDRSSDGYAIGLESGPNVMPNGLVLKAAVVGYVPSYMKETVAGLNRFDTVTITGLCTGSQKEHGRMRGMLIGIADASITPEPKPVAKRLPPRR